jgi:quinol monooxygenase YgiN
MGLIREVVSLAPKDGVNLEGALSSVGHLLAGAPGCYGYRLDRCIENPRKYLLTVEWVSLEAHTEEFRQSPAWSDFVAVLRDALREPPAPEHYEPVLQA